MTGRSDRFGRALFFLWLRLIAIAVIGLLIASIPLFPTMVAGWRYYQTTGEVFFEIFVRAIFISLGGVAFATLFAALVSPLLLQEASRDRRASMATHFFVGLTAFADLYIAFRMVAAPVSRLAGLVWFPTLIVYSLVFAGAMLVRRSRNQLVTSLDGLLTEKTTRRTAMTLGIATAGLVAAEFAAGEVTASRGPSPAPPRRPSGPSRPNILLVTFDALSADDMSLYGYRLPTTPNIDRFARKGAVFTNCYSASTFTTPSVATMVTGLYPSEHGVYHLQGKLSRANARRTLPHFLREAGYTTGVSTSSPHVFSLLEGLAPDLDFFPDAPYRTSGFDLWGASRILHQRQPWGDRDREFIDAERIRDLPANTFGKRSRFFARTQSGYSAAANFAQAADLLNHMPDGFFLWVHTFAPHAPYLPEGSCLGRFLPRGPMMTEQAQDISTTSSYKPELQPLMDQDRLRYDEFILESDGAFGSFLAGLENSGRLSNTAVVFSADHGESFEGGLYTHASSVQTRPEIHIPLVIRMPGQQSGSRVETAIDGTALVPTLLDIAGVARPASMRGRSLLPLLNTELPENGLAFTQFLAGNSIFRPIREGSVGVIDGSYQFVLDLASGRGILRPLAEAGDVNLDRSAEQPALALKLRSAIYSRFPDLPRQHG